MHVCVVRARERRLRSALWRKLRAAFCRTVDIRRGDNFCPLIAAQVSSLFHELRDTYFNLYLLPGAFILIYLFRTGAS